MFTSTVRHPYILLALLRLCVGAAATASRLLSLIPESILAWQRYAPEETTALRVIREVVEKEIEIINTPKSPFRRLRSSNTVYTLMAADVAVNHYFLNVTLSTF